MDNVQNLAINTEQDWITKTNIEELKETMNNTNGQSLVATVQLLNTPMSINPHAQNQELTNCLINKQNCTHNNNKHRQWRNGKQQRYAQTRKI